MVLDDDTLIVKAASLKINDDNGDEVFFVSPKETRTQFRALSLKGKAQALKSLQTKQIFSATDMKIASPTKKLLMSSAQDLTLKTGIGKVNVEALKDLDFEASKVRCLTLKKLMKFHIFFTDHRGKQKCLPTEIERLFTFFVNGNGDQKWNSSLRNLCVQ